MAKQIKGILGEKLGMTQVWDENNRVVPVTVVKAGPNVVTQVRTNDVDGYESVQIAFGEIDPRKVNKPLKGHFAKADVTPRRHLVEIRTADAAEYTLGQEVTADTRTFDPDLEARDRVVRFLERHLPGALGPIIYTKTCLYTLTPDRDFVLDVLPEHPEIAVAIGGGHGFKFASLIGQILSELSIDGHSPRDLAPFRIDRPILQLKDPPRNYMV